MTATITTRRPSDGADSLLRFAIRVEATLCAGIGLLTATTADPLSQLSGQSASAQWAVGAALVAYGGALYGLAGVPAIRRVGVGVIVAEIIAAMAAPLAGVLPLTAAGVAMVFATLSVAGLQYLGVRRLA